MYAYLEITLVILQDRESITRRGLPTNQYNQSNQQNQVQKGQVSINLNYNT